MEDQNTNSIPDAAAAQAAAGVTEEAVTPTPAFEDQLTAVQAKLEEYLAGWQRAVADYANLKRETAQAQAEFAKFASAGVITALLPVIDSFKKAYAARPAADADAAALAQWAAGIDAVKAQFDGIVSRAGVKAIDESGVAFDPTKHEAMMMEPASDGAKSGTIIRVLEPGYLMHDRVLRPAKVVVAE